MVPRTVSAQYGARRLLLANELSKTLRDKVAIENAIAKRMASPGQQRLWRPYFEPVYRCGWGNGVFCRLIMPSGGHRKHDAQGDFTIQAITACPDVTGRVLIGLTQCSAVLPR
jgi:hypothetical protein